MAESQAILLFDKSGKGEVDVRREKNGRRNEQKDKNQA